MEKRIKYLQGLLTEEQWLAAETKYRNNFDKYATYQGNRVYQWKGILSTDTRELYLMGVLRSENIDFEQE